MKNFSTLLTASLCLAFLNINAQKTNLTPQQYPQKIKSYVSKFFPNEQILKIEKEQKGRRTEYDVDLSGNVDLEFDKAFNLKKAESDTGIPSNIISKKIRDYVSANYPGARVTDWEKEANRQEVELDRKVKLIFDLKGNFLRSKAD